MTIMLERSSQPLLCAYESSTSTTTQAPQHDGPSLGTTRTTPIEDDFLLVDFSSCAVVGKDSGLVDDDTASTGSLSTDTCDTEEPRRVSFAKELITDVWTRPFTPRQEVATLFYSTEETSRFRQEYRLERKLLSELSVDPETFSLDEKDLAALVTPSSCQAYRISRVVVVHDNKLETFLDDAVDFDNDSFWSGSITWY